MFEVAFIQEQGAGRLDIEARMVRDACLRRDIPVELFTRKRIARRQLPLDPRSYVFGDVDCAQGAMRQLGIPVPAPDYYPDILEPYLHRRIWSERLGNLRDRIMEGGEPIFAKPALRPKLFTGMVFSGPGDFYFANGASRSEPVWCSEIVRWRSEYRVYVMGGRILSIDHYDGDPSVTIDRAVVERAVVERAIADLAGSGKALAGYGIDFGVLATGQTALVEANEGYALGAYGIDGDLYAALTFARWRELLGTITA
ncbi:ATP-grasp domain-containing protein [Sphingomonas sp. HF-S3]|uniref:ATP-grasp domain-containing protein n=1 Tax=Sphingomonas rustica TaxID=3103142 RepID=A0ABV0BFZ7_9SPHN